MNSFNSSLVELRNIPADVCCGLDEPLMAMAMSTTRVHSTMNMHIESLGRLPMVQSRLGSSYVINVTSVRALIRITCLSALRRTTSKTLQQRAGLRRPSVRKDIRLHQKTFN